MNLIYFKEIKYRFVYSLSGICCIFFISYMYIIQIIYLLTTLILIELQQKIYIYYIYTKITDILYSYFNLIFLIICVYSFLISCYHCFFFFKPGLYKTELKTIKKFLIWISFFYSFFLIVSSTYLFPKIYLYFLEYNQLNINTLNIFFELNIISFLNFLKIFFSICFFLISILQIYMYLIYQTNLSFYIFRKISIISNIILSTILTPPELINQIYFFILLTIITEFLLVNKILINKYKIFFFKI